MKTHKTIFEMEFLRWFPEISPKIFKNFRVLSIALVVENDAAPGGTTKFEFKKKEK